METGDWNISSIDYAISSVPEHKLMAAILGRAILDAVRDHDREGALEWMNHPEDTNRQPVKTGFTFIEVCEALSLNPQSIANRVRVQMHEEDRKRQVEVRLHS